MRSNRKAPMTTDTPLTRYSATNGALASGFVTAELHHLMGHDPRVDKPIWQFAPLRKLFRPLALQAMASPISQFHFGSNGDGHL
ncbi:hypothetical protein D3227_24560 [Mesorhizobium waimense]|uniref:Uncharacterized protein n=1 Tax=Mesorhizobium waimense TaxID=1300307 RepID=A0A3A5KGN7_9HYPH|nr:hypothetical protein D3227_24560 [Mesorhizobium waimense]